MGRKLYILTLFMTIIFLNVNGQQTVKNNPKTTNPKSRFDKLKVTSIPNNEFAEVINTSELTANEHTNDYSCKIVACCNGPSDPELDYCNCSTNFYITNGTYDLPNEYWLFKIGPFYSVDTTSLTPGTIKDTFLFTVKHSPDKKQLTHQFIIYQDKVTSVK